MPETIGLDIGSHSIKFVGLKMTSKGPFLSHAGIKELPAGMDREDVNGLAQLVKDLFQETGFKSKKVRLTVSGPGVNIRRITMPFMPKAELSEAVRWEIKGHLPYPVETAQIDFEILNEYVEGNVKKLDVMVVACPKPLIDRTLSIGREAGLEAAHLGVAPVALWNALLTWEGIGRDENLALIDMGAEKIAIHLYRDRILQFSREVIPAGADITRAVMEGMDAAEIHEIRHRKAEETKRELKIPLEAQNEGIVDKSINLSKISFLVRPVLERMVAEIGRSLDYYKNQFNVDRIDRVLLTGGGANFKSIASYLSGELRLPVELFNPLEKIRFDAKKVEPHLLNQMGMHLTVAAGTALTKPKQIEFLPVRASFLSRERILKSIPVSAPLLTLIVFLLIFWHTSGEVGRLEKEWNAKTAGVTKPELLQNKLAALKEKEKKLRDELSLFPSSVLLPVPYEDVLREITRIMPQNIVLNHLSVEPKAMGSKKEPQAEVQQDGQKEIHLGGLAFGNDVQCLTALVRLIEGLETSHLFKNAKLISAEENRTYNQRSAEFKILAEVDLDKPSVVPPLQNEGGGGLPKGSLGGKKAEDNKL